MPAGAEAVRRGAGELRPRAGSETGSCLCFQRGCRIAIKALRLGSHGSWLQMTWLRMSREKKSIILPFVLLGYSDDLSLQLQCASNYIANKIPLPPPPLWTGETWRHDKLRVAYLSADFRSHAVAYLMAGLFERHDRSRFEIIGVSFGLDDGSEMRKRLVAAFDQFHDVRRKSDEEVAKLLHDLKSTSRSI